MDEITEIKWNYWLRCDSWTLGEATCLLVGWNPHDDGERLPGDPIIEINDLVDRSIPAGKLKTLDDGRVIPSEFVNWASSKGIPIPEQLKPLLGEPAEQDVQEPEKKRKKVGYDVTMRRGLVKTIAV